MKKPDDWAIPPIPKVEREDSTILPQEQLISSAQASLEFTCTSVEEAIFWDCSIIFATASKMPERLRPPHLIKQATRAEKKQHDRRRVSCERYHRDDNCSFRGEVSATFTVICENGRSVIRDESCLLCGATTFANNRKCTSGSTRRATTSVRQLHPLDSVTSSAGKVKRRRQPFTRHTGNWVQKKWTNFGVLCTLQLVSGHAGWHDEPDHRMRNGAKSGTEWRDLVLADRVRPTLKGLILTCCEAAD